jgi:hypothetical protein
MIIMIMMMPIDQVVMMMMMGLRLEFDAVSSSSTVFAIRAAC